MGGRTITSHSLNLIRNYFVFKKSIQNSQTQKKIILIALGLIFVSTISFMSTVFALSIPVGNGPIGLQLVESLDLLFVTNQISNTVSIIDTSSNTIINTVPVGISPIAPAYVPSTSLLYVSNQGTSDVSVIDVSNPITASVVATIPVGTAPFRISYNSANEQVYVANCFSNDVSVIDVDPISPNYHTVVKTIPVGVCPTGIKANDSSNKIYTGNLFSNNVSVIDGNTDTVISAINVLGAGAISVDETNNRIFVSNALSGAITVVDGTTDTIIQNINVGNGPRESEFNPNSNQIFVANNSDGTVSIIDGTTLTVLGAVPVGSTPFGLEVNSSNVVYVANQDDNTVTILDIGSNVPPTANAGPDQIVNEGDFVQLDGSGSNDFDGDPLIYQWSQTDGPVVTLSSLSDPTPSFTAPEVSDNTLLEFQLIVNDGIFESLPDFVKIIVRDITVFEVPLNFIGGQLVGDITINNFPEDNQITFDFINPMGISEGKLEDAKLESKVSGTNVEFNFIADVEEPSSVPPLEDPALYYEIENTVIDFSNTANLAENNLPTSQFLINKNYNAGDNFSDGCPVVYKLLLNEDLNRWEIQGNPQIPNTNKIYSVDSIGNRVFVIDGNTHEIVDIISVGVSPRGSVFEPSLNKLYVTNLNSGTVSVIDTITNTVQSTIPVLGAAAIEIDTTTKKVYVPSFGLGTVTVIDANTDTIVDTIVTSGTALSEIVINPELQRLYILDGASNTMIVIDIPTKTEINTTPISGIPAGMALNPNNEFLYVAIFTQNTITVFDGVSNTIVKNIAVGFAPVGVEVNPVTNTVFVANAGSGTVSVIDSDINVEIDTINLEPSILGVDVNANNDRVYVVNQATGKMSIIDGSKRELLDSVLVSPGIFTITLNDSLSNPSRDPANDIIDSGTEEILECAYTAKLPHLSKFAVGGVASLFIAGLGGGGGSSAPTASLEALSSNSNFYIPEDIQKIIDEFDPRIPLEPMDPTLYEGFDFPLTINYNPYNGYPLAGYENTIKTNIVQVGTPVTLEFMYFGQTDLVHFSLYSGLYGSKSNPSESNVQILFNKDKDLEIYDPNENITDVKVTKHKLEDKKTKIVVEFTPTKENSLKDLIARSWDQNRSSLDIIVRNAFEIVPVTDEPTTKTYDLPIIEEYESQNIPMWIKNNAGWWSNQEISDDDFVSGIEYLIKNRIIIVPGIEVRSGQESSTIPDWIKNNAGWWSESLITDDEFINAMQWLVVNGVIQV